MSGRLSLVILRQYRFEIGFAVLIALLAAALGFITHLRLDDLGVSQDCLDQVQASEDGGDLEAECFRLARAGTEILGTAFVNSGGILQLSIMGLLPFVVGVFGGIPVVARELEDRTAQTAWWLNGSRVRWLLQRLGRSPSSSAPGSDSLHWRRLLWPTIGFGGTALNEASSSALTDSRPFFGRSAPSASASPQALCSAEPFLRSSSASRCS